MTESTQLPILDELEAMTTYMQMAEWLTACPLAIFVSHGHQIAALVDRRGFIAGGDYVKAHMRMLSRVRAGDADDHVSRDAWPSDYSLWKRARELEDAATLVADIDLSWRKPAEGASASARPSACEAPSGGQPEGRAAARTTDAL